MALTYTDDVKGTSKPSAPSLSEQADNVVEAVRRARDIAESILNELLQADSASPLKPGVTGLPISGKLADATEHSDGTFATLQEIRMRLFGDHPVQQRS